MKILKAISNEANHTDKTPKITVVELMKAFPHMGLSEAQGIIEAYKSLFETPKTTITPSVVKEDGFEVNDNTYHQTHTKGTKGTIPRKFTIKEYNEKGNLIHSKDSTSDNNSKDSDGFETWYKYDDDDILISVHHCRNSDDFEEWFEFDKRGNQIHSKDSDGIEIWRDYDDKNNEIHYVDSKGNELWYEYDERGMKIHYKSSRGF